MSDTYRKCGFFSSLMDRNTSRMKVIFYRGIIIFKYFCPVVGFSQVKEFLNGEN